MFKKTGSYMKATRNAALAVLFSFFSAHAAPPQRYDVEISLREKKIVEPAPEGLSLVFWLNLKNTTSQPLFLARYDYRLVVEQTEYLNLQTTLEEPIRIEPKGETMIALPVKITYGYLFQAVPSVRDKDQAACFLTGGMTFQDERRREKRIPIALSGDFPVFRGLDIRILPIEAKDLTVGGADLVFKAALKNPNGFSFNLDGLTYKLDFVGITVSEGTVGEEGEVESRGEKIFVIPLLLDFFEIGKVVYDGLEQPPVAVRISGEAEISSAWGNFKIPFYKSEKVGVEKTGDRLSR
jgi:LEA14-like dessication related protein